MNAADRRPAGQRQGAPERRQLTVLICDLVGSTALSSEMELEDFHDLMLAYQRYCARCVEDAGGFVARFSGDGVLAYFGYPVALEDAPQRAIHAALRIRAVGQHLAAPAGRPLAVRTGIATGLVVVGDLIGAGPAAEHTVAGATPSLAARLQVFASPNGVVISETTKRLAEGVFEFHALGLVQHKGLPSAEPAWEVIGQSPTVSRFDGRRGLGVNPLVSRETELDELLEAWRDAREGRRRVIGIVGDPGLGKSRLLEEARRRICQDTSVAWLEGGGVSIYDNTPFHVAAQLVSRLAALGGAPGTGDSPGGPGADPETARAMSLIAGAVGGPGKSGADAGGQDAARGRAALLDLLKQGIWRAAERGPTVLVVEDLHWVDPSTLEFLDLVVGADDERPLLVVYTSRTEVTGRWPLDARHRVIALDALDGAASATLARSAVGDQLSLAQVEAIVSQANGVPLYIEELARLIANQPVDVSADAVPPSLADLLAARLEELGPAKRHAQVAAVLGQEFAADLFAAMVEPDGVDPALALADLEALSIIVPGKVEAQGAYVFRHALIANSAYEALLMRERRALHGRAAAIIIERYPAIAQTRPQVLARHWAQAGDAPKAVAAWERAGDSANDRRAFREAEHAYREALSVLRGGADLPDRDELELRIRAVFIRVLQITQGYSSPEAERSSERVRELAIKAGNAEALSREERAMWRSVFTSGDYAQAEAIVARFMSLTQARSNSLSRQTFYLRAGVQHGFYTGDLARGERDFLAWSTIQDGSHRASGDDVLTTGIAGLIAHMTGRQAVAEQRMAAAFAIAGRQGNPYDLAMALHCQTCLFHFSRDAAGRAGSAARLAEVAGESGFEYARYLADGWLAIATAKDGDVARALQQAGQVIAGLQRLGAHVSMVFWLSVLAWAQQLGGDPASARRTFAQAIAFNPQERAFRVEAYLGRARLLDGLGETVPAERDLRDGIRLAADMGATSFQLRCLVELARMQLAADHGGELGRTLGSIQALVHPGHCAFDIAAVDALSRETGVALAQSPSRWEHPDGDDLR